MGVSVESPSSRILVIRGGAIGDFILTLPAIKFLRDSFPAAHLEILGYKHIVALAEMSRYADATRSIEYGPLSSFFSRESELAPELVDYFGGFQQVISYLFDPDEIFCNNLKRAGVRNLIAGSPKITGQEHAARQLARPLEQSRALLGRSGGRSSCLTSRETSIRSLIAIHPGSGSADEELASRKVRSRWRRRSFDQTEDSRLLLIGGEADEERATQLARALPAERVSVREESSAARARRPARRTALCSSVTTAAFRISPRRWERHALLLFGPTDPAIWAPANRQVRVLRSPSLAMAGIDQCRDVVDALRRSLRTDAHRHQDVEERALNLDHARAHLVDQVEKDFVLGQIAQRRHEELRIERDGKLAALVGDRQAIPSLRRLPACSR